MSQPDKKLEKFTSAVLKDAEDQRAIILQEIEDYRKAEMEKAEEEILHEAYVLIQNEIAAVKNLHSRQISLSELDSRRSLLKLREDITKDVFGECAKRIIEFSNTTEYVSYLSDILKKNAASVSGNNIVIKVKKGDLAIKDKLLAAFSKNAAVEADDGIFLGGVIIYDQDHGIVIDETLDSKLNNQKDWFTANSGLTIGL